MANTTWNPSDKSNVTLSGGNLIAVTGSSSAGGVRSVHSITSGKYYWECTFLISSNSLAVGVSLVSANLLAPTTGNASVRRLGGIFVNGTASGSLGIIAQNAVVGIAIDLGASLIWFRVAPSGNWNGSGTADPAAATGGLSISSISGALFADMNGDSGDQITANFGDSSPTGAVPSGFTLGFPASAAAGRTRRLVTVAT